MTTLIDSNRLRAWKLSIVDGQLTQNRLLVLQKLVVAPRQQFHRVLGIKIAALHQTLAGSHEEVGELASVDAVVAPSADTVGNT